MKKSITLNLDELIELTLKLGSAMADEKKWYEYFCRKGFTHLAQEAFNKATLFKKLHDFVVDAILQQHINIKLSQEELP